MPKPKCHKGDILRSSHRRKDETCIPPKLKEGLLEKYGYKLLKNAQTRERALEKAIRGEGSLLVLRRVVVLRTYQKNNPSMFRKLDKDVKYIQKVREKNSPNKVTTKVVKKTLIKKVIKRVHFNL